MEKPAAIVNRSYEDFDPVCKWRREDDRDIIVLHIPGFKREHVRIQINHLGFMVIRGECPMGGTRRKRFKKEVELPTDCNEVAIHANFSQSILSVVMPKKVPPIYEEVQKRQIPETEHEIEEEKETNQNMESTTKEALAENTHATDNHFVKNDVGLTPERTREIALKFMVMIIVILVIVSYVENMSKSLMAKAQYYFQD